jgi:hypothetical protein
MGTLRTLLALTTVSAALFFAGEHKQLLGPRDPIAADGSLQAGRALTISDKAGSRTANVGSGRSQQVRGTFFQKSG